MAGFAWLLLVAMPVHPGARGMPASMPMESAAAGPVKAGPMTTMGSMMVVGPHSRAAAPAKTMHADGCCDPDRSHGTAPGCHCATSFGTVLVAVGVRELSPMVPDAVRPSLHTGTAPDIADGPPLRPPAV